MRLSELVRYAVSDLRHRSVTTSFNVLAVALAAVYVLVLGFWGASIHHYQSTMLDESLPTQIVASVPDVTDTARRFTDERLEELRALPGVSYAMPRVEINVRVGRVGDRTVDVPAEGTLPDDPGLSPTRMAFGARVSGPRAAELVLSLGLFEKLGGTLDGGPQPDRLALEVRRTVDGRDQTQRLELAVAGLVEYQREDKVFVPLELLRDLNLWCRNRIDSLAAGETREPSRLARYPHLVAYVPESQLGRVASELEHWQVAAERAGEIEVLEADGPVWAVLERAAGGASAQSSSVAGSDARAAALLVGARAWPVAMREVGGHTVAALAADDPRWGLCAGAQEPGFRRFLAATPAGSRLAPAAASAPAGFPVEADVVCDAEEFARFFFVARESNGVETCTLIETRDPAAARAVSRLARLAPFAGYERGHAFYRTPPTERTPGARASRASFGAWEEAPVDVARAGGPRLALRAHRLPARFLATLAGLHGDELAPSGACVLVSPYALLGSASLDVAGATFAVAASVRFPRLAEELFLCGGSPRLVLPHAGLVAWGDWDELLEVAEEARVRAWTLDEGLSHVSPAFAGVLEGDLAAAREALGPAADACRLTEFPAARVRLAESRATILAASGRELGSVPPGVLQIRQGVRAASVGIATGAWRSPALSVDPFVDLPPGLGVVDEALFEEAAWRASTRRPGLAGLAVAERHELGFPGPLEHASAARALAAAGFALRPIVDVRSRALARFRVTDPAAEDGAVGPDLVAVLRMSQPTFATARPALALDVELEGGERDLSLVASEASDPERFLHVPLAGRWIRADLGRNQVVLPRAILGSSASDDGREYLGRSLFAHFRRESFRGAEDALRIPLEVVGVIEGDEAFAPVELLSDVRLWQLGKLVFNETRGAFESPLEVSLRGGDVRCNLYARSREDVAGVVAALRARGYPTEDSLAAQQNLRRLGRVLAGIVVVFVLGCLVNASITVLVATLMNVKSKVYEIGILRAHGLRRREILSIFATQGAVVGTLAFVAAVLVVLLLEPRLRVVVRQVFQLREGSVLAGSPFDVQWWWLAPTAFLIAALFSLGGVLIPAYTATSLSPVDALRRRE